MHVYFVRHGATDAGYRYRHQSPNTPLSAKGKEEAEDIGEYLRAMNPDYLISSEYTRAQETAQIIGAHLGLTPVTNDLFYELVRPSALFETSIFSPRTVWYALLSVIRRNNAAWHYQDAENFNDIRDRAVRALAHLTSLAGTHQSVVVVSHTIFINIMIMYMCENRMLGVRDIFKVMRHSRRLRNGSFIHIEYNGTESRNTCSWHPVLT